MGGGIALLAGLIPLLSKKGSRRHKFTGKIFVYSMLLVCLTAIALSILNPNIFLLLIGIFSLYLTLTGYRALRLKNAGPEWPTWFDYNLSFAMILCGIGLLLYAFADIPVGSLPFNPILLSFGCIGLTLAAIDLRLMRQTKQQRPYAWFFRHLTRMLAAYIAASTAFLVVNAASMFAQASGLLMLLAWLGPTLIGTMGIIVWTAYYRRRFKTARRMLRHTDS